jgi:hypothetical protein
MIQSSATQILSEFYLSKFRLAFDGAVSAVDGDILPSGN